MYQRLGLEDDIVDPSNTLLREGPVLKISFRRNGPMERYLFLVGKCWGPANTGEGSPQTPLPQVPPAWHLPGTTGTCLFLYPLLLWHPGDLEQVTCCLQASGIPN